MDYKEFIEMVKQDLPQKLSGILEGANISNAKVEKIQGNSYEGISVTPAGSFMGVTMDLKPYFEMYNDGLSKEYILERIAGTANSGYEQRPVLTKDMLLDYETMKHRLVLQVVGRENKEEMLKNIPHYDLADLAVIYRLKFGQDDLGLAAVTITNGLLKEYGITSEQLHQDALKQALFDEPCFLKNMSEVIADLSGDMFVPEMEPPLFVASNRSTINGASVIAYPDFMENAAKQLEGSFYLLPSSIDEVILVPERLEMSVSELQAMVQDINATQVRPEQRLSDYVYHYDSKEKVFERADAYVERKREQSKNREIEPNSVLKTLHNHQKECMERPKKEITPHHRGEIAL